jgi:hypothetical protein
MNQLQLKKWTHKIREEADTEEEALIQLETFANLLLDEMVIEKKPEEFELSPDMEWGRQRVLDNRLGFNEAVDALEEKKKTLLS